ncbi:hypothetical protein B5V03_15660 [Bradyrhizobium betae]|uniref:Uncharacterized protein n=2 Tax=Bradyrhizobium betae TaxID=244734 RepID=A0A4Q1VC53_9BRAD|nr:hypothetical protein B5V03_15660 [Bradyrhizobium betae]
MLGRLVIAGTISLISVQVASAACLSGDQKLPAATVNNFVANPSSILGAADLAQTVRDLVASDSSTLSPVLALLQGASGDQQGAIGSGLGQAASVLCLQTDPNFAAEIQDRVNNSQSAPAKTAYAAITGDKNRTLATNASGAGISPGGVGGGTNPAANTGNGTGSTFTFSAESVRGNGLNYFSGGVTGISGVTSTTTTAARTTSP